MSKPMLPSEVSERLDISIPYLKALAKHGDGPTYHVAHGNVRFHEADVAEYEAYSLHMESICSV